MRRTATVVVLLLAAGALAAEGLQAKSYAVGLTDPRTAAATIRALLSPAGTVVEDPAGNRIVVIDVPAVHERVREALQSISFDTRNVRITVTSVLERDTRSRRIVASSGARAGPVTGSVGPRPPERGVRVEGGDGRTSRRMTTQQTIVTLSGTRASITIAEQVPYADWFWTWGLGQGLWTAAAVASVGWHDVGTRMTVEPTVLGDGRVRVRLTPSFEYFVDRERRTTEVTALSTDVVVAEGAEIDLGGVPFRDSEFQERFLLGFGASGEAESVVIKLRVEVQ
jgi:type II secretory pathway component GspD/PulD (secretin)